MKTQRLAVDDLELARRAFTMMGDVFGEVDREVLSDGYLQEILARRDLWALAAVHEGEPIGALTAHLLPMTRAETAELFIYDLAVRPDWQRRGVGRVLVQHLIAAAEPAKVSSIFVPADQDDTDALAFYRAMGGAAEAVTIFTFPPRQDSRGRAAAPASAAHRSGSSR